MGGTFGIAGMRGSGGRGGIFISPFLIEMSPCLTLSSIFGPPLPTDPVALRCLSSPFTLRLKSEFRSPPSVLASIENPALGGSVKVTGSLALVIWIFPNGSTAVTLTSPLAFSI